MIAIAVKIILVAIVVAYAFVAYVIIGIRMAEKANQDIQEKK